MGNRKGEKMWVGNCITILTWEKKEGLKIYKNNLGHHNVKTLQRYHKSTYLAKKEWNKSCLHDKPVEV